MISKMGKAEEMEDNLSSLPDDIITKILENLKTKEVLRTRILSRRWKSSWESLPTFDLHDGDFRLKGEDLDGSSVTDQNMKARFSNFVDRVLVARKSLSLEKISIKTSAQIVDGNVMISWMRAAMERHVSELDIDFVRQGDIDETPSELTTAMFACNKLSVLKLSTNMMLYIPTETSSFLPNLKYLKLYDVSYKDDRSLENLLLNCPNLEDLLIVRPRWQNMGTSTIKSLGTLIIRSRSLKTLLVDSTFEEPENEVKKILIDAPALESIDISCKTSKKFLVKDFRCLVEAKLDLADVSKECLKIFLTKVSDVKVLTLKPETTLSLVLAGSVLSDIMPIFHNLTHLNIYGVNYEYAPVTNFTEWAVMLKILKSSPKLETLILQNFSRSFGESSYLWETWDVPDCLVSRLKNFEIDILDLSPFDALKIKYFWRRAQALKTVTVRSRVYDKRMLFELFLKYNLPPGIRDSVIWSYQQFTVRFP